MLKYNITTNKVAKGDIVIRRMFSLVAHDYKDQIFKLVWIFRNLHGLVVQYINFSIGITSQQFVAFKFIKICVFRIHSSFSRFHTEYNFDQISRKCRGTFQRYKFWNVDGRNAMQFQKFNFLSLRMLRDLHGNVTYVIRMLNSMCLSLFLDKFPTRPKTTFCQRNVATYIHNIM